MSSNEADIFDDIHEALRDAGDGARFTNFHRGEMTPTRLRASFAPDLPNVLDPTLFIHAEKDPLVPLDEVEAAARSTPNADLEIMDAGHWPMRDDPTKFNERVLSFFKGVKS